MNGTPQRAALERTLRQAEHLLADPLTAERPEAFQLGACREVLAMLTEAIRAYLESETQS